MKQKKIAACLCMAVLLTMAGCGNTDAGQAVQTADIQTQDQTGETAGGDSGSREKETKENGIDSEDSNEDIVSEEPAGKQEDTALDGIVISIGDDSVVVSQMVTESGEEGDTGEVMVWEASEGEEITAYFSEDTQFVFKTVKNSGVNGDADVETREGSLADIREGSVVNMTGSYQGDDFQAGQVVIYKFV